MVADKEFTGEWVSFNALLMDYQQKRKRSSKKKKIKNKLKELGWFGTCTLSQLKDLCRASKLPVSGTKEALCLRLLQDCPVTSKYGGYSQRSLREVCQEKSVAVSGNKFEQILRLVKLEFGTEADKKTPSKKQSPGQKPRQKPTISPKTLYTRISKKMNAVTQKKYQSHNGSKRHPYDVYYLMKELMRENCFVPNKENPFKPTTVIDDPLLAMELCGGIFRAFDDNFHVMIRTGYDQQEFREAVDMFGEVLKVAKPKMTQKQIEDIVDLLESIEASVRMDGLHKRTSEDAVVYYSTGGGKDETYCSEYRQVKRYHGDNVFVDTISILLPSYDKSTRPKKRMKLTEQVLAGWSSMIC